MHGKPVRASSVRTFEAMNKRELAERLAKQAHKSRAKAADEVDSLVYGLLKDLKEAQKKPTPEVANAAPKPPATPESTENPSAKEKK